MFMTAAILCFIFGSAWGGRPEVTILDGTVRGTELQTFRGRTIYGFYNIPYTKKLTQRRRFEELEDADPWDGVLDGGGPANLCPQVNLRNQYAGVENCLFINVFTPSLPRSSSDKHVYPVVLFLHGGAYYFFGSALFGPRYLLDRDVVLVTFNFRIGVPGFGSTSDYVLPGNLGLKDQLKAMNWVQRNIHFFAGDRNSVTLFGMSSGATSVHLHYFSNQSRGLFHRGVMLGGFATVPWATYDRPLGRLQRLSRNLGCPTNTTYDMVVCLQSLPARDLALGIPTIQGPAFLPLGIFSPVVDDYSHNPFMLEFPYESLHYGKYAKLPMLVSNAEYEGIFPGGVFTDDENLLRDIDMNWLSGESSRGQFVLSLDHVPDAFLNDTLMRIRNYYFGDAKISQATMNEFLTMMSDRHYITDTVKAIHIISRNNPNVYYYRFAYKGQQTTASAVSQHPERYGPSHVDDFFYMMNVTDRRLLEDNATSVLMIERLTTMLSSFARTGVPDFGTDVVFRPLGRSASIYEPIRGLLIRSPDDMEMTDLNIGSVRFWESLPMLQPRRPST